MEQTPKITKELERIRNAVENSKYGACLFPPRYREGITPKHLFVGIEYIPTSEIPIFICYKIFRNHIFIDGNKRTITLLLMENYDFQLDKIDLLPYTINAIATNSLSYEEFRQEILRLTVV